VDVRGFQPSGGSTVELLGTSGNLKWLKEGEGFKIKVPAGEINRPPCKYAWVFKVKMNNKDQR
jgi:hypothetical protein